MKRIATLTLFCATPSFFSPATRTSHRVRSVGSLAVLSLVLAFGCSKQQPTMTPEAESGQAVSAPQDAGAHEGPEGAARDNVLFDDDAQGEVARPTERDRASAKPAEAEPVAVAPPQPESSAAQALGLAGAPSTPAKSADKGKTKNSGQGVGSGAGRLGAASRGVQSRPMSKKDLATGGVASDELLVAGGDPLASEFKTPTDTSGESYAYLPENDFVHVSDDPLSTFSVDVDTASFANVRRFIRSGQMPPIDAIRIEEFINYFRFESRENAVRLSAARPVEVESEVGPAPWAPDHRLVRLTMHSLTPPTQEMPPRNLVFLIDVSGSMMDPDKLPLLKQAFSLLTERLRPDDFVSMVVYAGASGVVLPPTSGRDRGTILAALERLQAGGSTNGGEGIALAYAMAREHYRPQAVNRVILATDGDFNVGTTGQGDLVRMIERKREEGIDLSVLGFGTGNLKDQTMEQLADKGNGNYAYIDSLQEARKVLVQEAGSTLVTVAKDVKIQVEFNPKKVASYRLIGYENRRLAHRDFNDDRKDAGEVGAGHTVTALYEIVAQANEGVRATVDPLRYQERPTPRPESSLDELLHVKVRYKAPKGASSELLSFQVIDRNNGMDRSSQDFRFAAAVASYGMVLRHSKYRGAASLRDIESWATQGIGDDANGYRRDFVELVRETRKLSGER